MKRPDRRNEIYSTLRSEILSVETKYRERFPPEPELAERFHVARGTIRSVLALLEEEGLIERVRGLGTKLKADSKQPILTYLAPCNPVVFEESRPGYAFISFNHSLHGAMIAAEKHHIRIELLPVSEVNEPDKIDWTRFSGLSGDSRILVSSTWYEYLFPFFHERGCRVSVIFEGNPTRPETQKIMKSFSVFELDSREMIRRLTSQLLKHGAKHPAFCGLPENEPDHVRLLGFQDALRDAGIPRENGIIVRSPQILPNDAHHLILFDRIREVMRKTPFDALVMEAGLFARLGCRKNMYTRLGCDPEMHIGMFNTVGSFLGGFPGAFLIDFPRVQATNDAAEALLAPDRTPIHRIYPAGPVRVGPEDV